MYEWDEGKNQDNIKKHGISFDLAKEAFNDPKRLILVDEHHSQDEERHFCVGKVGEMVLTVRFVLRNGKIRIFGAGHWRKERKYYEQRNQIH
ncbi:MAG: BrnT family toxin [Clostridiales bacterium]|jgi:uncharacterized DUF497 family protein|nr:BrnT family toxin [Clostridiales bacterium]